jgi:RNA polymerase sigma-70 factor (sigma-E family)
MSREQGTLAASVELFPLRTRVRTRSTVDSAFADVVDRHARDLARFAYMFCGDRNQAEEVVAEAFSRAWPRWRRGQIDALLPYVRRSIVHEVHGRSRRWRLERREQERRRVAGPDGTFEDRVTEQGSLWPLVARLPYAQRAVVVLRVVEDLPEDETAEMLGVPVGTVKSRLARGLAALREMVEDRDA